MYGYYSWNKNFLREVRHSEGFIANKRRDVLFSFARKGRKFMEFLQRNKPFAHETREIYSQS